MAAIHINQRSIGSIYHNGRAIKSVFEGKRLVWTSDSQILSCYANGYWIDEYPWTDNTPWKSN